MGLILAHAHHTYIERFLHSARRRAQVTRVFDRSDPWVICQVVDFSGYVSQLFAAVSLCNQG
jgi:hypothetical protein